MQELIKNPNPTKDQHFMVDQNMLQRIYDTAGILPGESIVEIGGGEGALTDYLIAGNNMVTVIEKDPYYANYLRKKYQGVPNVQVIEGDALDYDFSAYDRIVANLPYTITEPFLMNLAKSGTLDYNSKNPNMGGAKSITLVLGQNAVRKMVAPIQITEGGSRHANSEFGTIGAICKTFCDISIECAIPSKCFYPEPATTSFLVNLTPKTKKTTVDRIMREFLVDKKGNCSTIHRLYQLMLARGEIYKTGKHKNSFMSETNNANFTSKTILNSNIYSLTNQQISTLIQDLVRNDISMKSKRGPQGHKLRGEEYLYEKYFVNGRFNFDVEEIEDLYDDEYAEDVFQKQKEKYVHTYDYLYDSELYNILLSRGLENLSDDDLQELIVTHDTEILSRRKKFN